jgi:effector-binding domain-containing protein
VEHVGPYDTLPEAYRRGGEEAAAFGWKERPGPSLEFFENDPTSAPSEQLRTWVYLPVTKAAS